jgi:hypothetical protein
MRAGSGASVAIAGTMASNDEASRSIAGHATTSPRPMPQSSKHRPASSMRATSAARLIVSRPGMSHAGAAGLLAASDLRCSE